MSAVKAILTAAADDGQAEGEASCHTRMNKSRYVLAYTSHLWPSQQTCLGSEHASLPLCRIPLDSLTLTAFSGS